MTDLARCEKCGYEGVYGVEVVDVDWYSPVTQRDSIALMCKNIKDCYQRELAWDRKSKEAKMLHTTFRRAKEAGACKESYRKFAKFKGGVRKWGIDKPFPLSEVLEVCGLDDALWALRIVIEPAKREIRLLACDFAEHVLPIYERKYPGDTRPRDCIDTTRRFADGKATLKELNAARNAAREAAWDARDAAAWAAEEAAWAAREAARDAAAWAARAADWAAARAAEEREWQKQKLIELLNSYKE